jgi:hypothetical protein
VVEVPPPENIEQKITNQNRNMEPKIDNHHQKGI